MPAVLYLLVSFHGVNPHPRRECYEIATKLLRIYYEFDCVPWVFKEGKKKSIFNIIDIINRRITSTIKDNKK